jgi:nucleoside-diphosphate-sugar epimerase
VHVEDLCDAILAALERDAAARREYDIGGPAPLTLAELVRDSARALGRPAWLVPVPLGPAHRLAIWSRRWGLPFPVSPEQVLRLVESKAVDIEPARRDLDFRPRAFASGISDEVRVFRSTYS